MSTKLYVGSLSYNVNDEELSQYFSSVGTVVSAVVIKDRETDRSKGFGFVEMSDEKEAKEAIEKLNGTELNDRSIIVSEARPQEDRSRRNGGGGGGGNFNRNRDNFNKRRY